MNWGEYENKGWVKLHRAILDDPIIMKDRDHLAIYIYLLLAATHKERDVLFNNRRIKLNPGQLITGRKRVAETLRISESKVQRVLKRFESEQQIEQLTTTKCRLITIKKWDYYQHFNQKLVTDRTSSKQQLNTKQELKNNINIAEPNLEEVIEYFQSKGLPIKEAENFWSFYDSQDWRTKGGVYIGEKWESKVIGWINNSKQFKIGIRKNNNEDRFEKSIGS